jgi:hypothetical protein
MAREHESLATKTSIHRRSPARKAMVPDQVDRVYRASISPDGTTTLRKDATEAIAQENGIKIERIRWLSKASDKMYGSVVIFLTDQHEAETLLAKGVIDLGGRWHTPGHTNGGSDRLGASNATSMGIWRPHAQPTWRCAASVRSQVTLHRNAHHPGPMCRLPRAAYSL